MFAEACTRRSTQGEESVRTIRRTLKQDGNSTDGRFRKLGDILATAPSILASALFRHSSDCIVSVRSLPSHLLSSSTTRPAQPYDHRPTNSRPDLPACRHHSLPRLHSSRASAAIQTGSLSRLVARRPWDLQHCSHDASLGIHRTAHTGVPRSVAINSQQAPHISLFATGESRDVRNGLLHSRALLSTVPAYLHLHAAGVRRVPVPPHPSCPRHVGDGRPWMFIGDGHCGVQHWTDRARAYEQTSSASTRALAQVSEDDRPVALSVIAVPCVGSPDYDHISRSAVWPTSRCRRERRARNILSHLLGDATTTHRPTLVLA